MTSEARETSAATGVPVQLFKFTRGTVEWCYTTADRDMVVDGRTFVPAPISHSEINDGGESNKVSITITMPKTLPVAGNWRPYSTRDTVAVTVWTQHEGETDWLVDWIGRVISPEFDDTRLRLRSEPSATTAKRGGRGRICQRPCDHIWGSEGCGVDPAEHELPATLDAVTGLSLQSTSFLLVPSGRLAGGWIQWVRSDGVTDYRNIEAHSGDTITIDESAADLAAALAVSAFPGCAQTWEDCEYYENTDNYGGYLYMPTRNFYDGNPVR